MRLVFVITTLGGGGAEKAVVVLANHFAALGYRITIVCTEPDEVAYCVDSRVKIVTLLTGHLVRGYYGKGILLPLQALDLAIRLRLERPNATVSFLVRPNLTHVMTKWFGNRRKVFVCEQVASKGWYENLGWPGWQMLRLTRWLYSKADGILTASAGVWEGLKELGVRNDSVHIIHNPISIAELTAEVEKLPFPAPEARPFQVVTMGRLCEQKDHPTLLRAFAKLVQDVDAHLSILGEGPDREATRRLIDQLGLSDRVRLVGWLTNPFSVVASSDLFVLSSRYEGFGNVLVEAMACGVPIVSTDCPSGPSEILLEGRFGRLVPIEDPEALAEAMRWTLSLDRHERDALGRRNFERATEFDVSVVARRYLDALGLPSDLPV